MAWKQPIPKNLLEICRGNKLATTIYLNLIWRARNIDEVYYNNGEPVDLKRGQIFTGRFELAQWVGMKRSQASRIQKILIFLEKTLRLIDRYQVRHGSIISIVNYDSVVRIDQITNDLRGRLRTDKGQIKGTKVSLYKSDKSDKSDNLPKNEFSDDSLEMVLSQKLFDWILKNSPKAKIKPDSLRKWVSEVDKMIRLDSRTEEEIERLIDFSQQHDFWKSNIRSMGKLRDKFDTLELQMTEQSKKYQSKQSKYQEVDRLLAERKKNDKK